MFVYAEHFAGKRPNEVILCLDFYISILGDSTKKLHIFVDNCFSQNKNYYLVAYLQVLANTKLEEVHVHYPLHGHSRMPCDRDFGRIEKKRRRKDRVVGPSEWVKLIKEIDQADPFSIVYVKQLVTDDITDDGTPVVKVKNYKGIFDDYLRVPNGISTIRGILFKRGMGPLYRYSMTGESHVPLICL